MPGIGILMIGEVTDEHQPGKGGVEKKSPVVIRGCYGVSYSTAITDRFFSDY